MFSFQNSANSNPEISVVTIQSGGFKVKTHTPRQKQQFEAHNGADAGSIELTGPTADYPVCHDWHYSADGITFTRMEPSLNAHTVKEGLTPGDYAYFKHQLINKDGGEGYSQIIKIRVI